MSAPILPKIISSSDNTKLLHAAMLRSPKLVNQTAEIPAIACRRGIRLINVNTLTIIDITDGFQNLFRKKFIIDFVQCLRISIH